VYFFQAGILGEFSIKNVIHFHVLGLNSMEK